MSGVFKFIKKIFKAVVKVIKVVAPIALAVGAVIFTGGAALGLTLPTWGAAVTSVFGTTGLGAIASGAVTWAGYGAAIGGLTAAVTGKNVLKGMQSGALTGAVTGGIAAGLGGAKFIDPIGDALAKNPAMSVAGRATVAASGEGALGTSTAATVGAPGQAVGADMAAAGTPTAAAAPSATGMGLQRGLSTAATSFWDKPGAIPLAMVGGSALSGLGSGLGAAGAADAAAQADRLKQDRIAANYALPMTDKGAASGPQSAAAPAVTPQAAAVSNPGAPPMEGGLPAPNLNGRWIYDKAEGHFVFVPNNAYTV